MNEAVIPRPCWTLLAQKAQDELELIQQEAGRTRARIGKLQASLARLEKMHQGYSAQLNQAGSQSQGMREAMSQRQFMAQLLTLMERVQTDIQHASNQLEAFQERMAVLEKERLKMQTLADKNAEELQRLAKAKEQRRMDEVAVMQFNRRLAS